MKNIMFVDTDRKLSSVSVFQFFIVAHCLQKKIKSLIIKITISLIVIGLKNSYFSTNSLAKLLSDIYLIRRFVV